MVVIVVIAEVGEMRCTMELHKQHKESKQYESDICAIVRCNPDSL